MGQIILLLLTKEYTEFFPILLAYVRTFVWIRSVFDLYL